MLKKIIKVLVFGYLLIGIAIAVFQEKFLFLPQKTDFEKEYTWDHPFEEFNLYASDSARLNGVRFRVKEPRGVILYFHGNAGNLERWGGITMYFLQFNYDLIVMDYRSYGKSTGDLSQENLYTDAQLFYNYTAQLYSEENIVLYGRSLGSAFATYLAASNHPKLLLLESPFSSITEVAQGRFPIYPVWYLLKYPFDNMAFTSDITCPTYIIHGTSDRVVPYRLGKKLYEALPEIKKQLISIPEGGHNNLIDFTEYHQAMEQILGYGL